MHFRSNCGTLTFYVGTSNNYVGTLEPALFCYSHSSTINHTAGCSQQHLREPIINECSASAEDVEYHVAAPHKSITNILYQYCTMFPSSCHPHKNHFAALQLAIISINTELAHHSSSPWDSLKLLASRSIGIALSVTPSSTPPSPSPKMIASAMSSSRK